MRKQPVTLSRHRNVVAARLALGLALANIVAASASAFPLDVKFTLVSLNGGDFYVSEWQTNDWVLADRAWPKAQPLPPIFSIHYDATLQEYAAGGFSGCNEWGVKVDLLPENRLVFAPRHYSTAVACVGLMKSESRYVSAVLRATQWRMDGDALVLEGDGNIIRFETHRARNPL
jgi:heat shock protein HslJ